MRFDNPAVAIHPEHQVGQDIEHGLHALCGVAQGEFGPLAVIDIARHAEDFLELSVHTHQGGHHDISPDGVAVPMTLGQLQMNGCQRLTALEQAEKFLELGPHHGQGVRGKDVGPGLGHDLRHAVAP